MSSSRDRGVTRRGAIRPQRRRSHAEHRRERAEVGAVGGVGAAGDVGGDVAGDVAVERVASIERARRRAAGRARRCRSGRRGSGTVSATSASSSSPISRSVVPRGERRPTARRRALGMGDEQLVVVGPADLLGDERQHVATEVERLAGSRAARRSSASSRKRGSGASGRLQPVVELRPVRHAAARADVEDRLAPARLVARARRRRPRRSGRRGPR